MAFALGARTGVRMVVMPVPAACSTKSLRSSGPGPESGSTAGGPTLQPSSPGGASSPDPLAAHPCTSLPAQRHRRRTSRACLLSVFKLCSSLGSDEEGVFANCRIDLELIAHDAPVAS